MTHTRRGYSLLELLTVITLLGAAMTMITVSLHGLYRADARLRHDLERERALEHFATRWRWDAHEALSAQASHDATTGASLKLQLADGQQVVYTTSPRGIERTLYKDSSVARRETFVLDAQAEAQWEVVANPAAISHLVLRLEIPGRRGAPAHHIDFAAALGIFSSSSQLPSPEAR